MLRAYRAYNPIVGFSKYESNNKLLGGVTFFRVMLGVKTKKQKHKKIKLKMK